MALTFRRTLSMLAAAVLCAAGFEGSRLNSLQGLDLGLHQLFTEPKPRRLVADPAEGIQKIVAENCAFWNVTGCSVGVSFKGSEIFASFGVLDKTSGAEVGPDSLFQIGSTTKAYTTMAILQRVAKGELDLDVPVTKYLPEFSLNASGADGLTLRDLLSHRTGMPRHELLWLFFLPGGRTEEARMDLVRRLPGLALTKPIRYGFEYNNLMFITAGLIAGLGHKDGWEGLVNDEVLKPLNMTDTWMHVSDLDAAAQDRLATPYLDGTAQETFRKELVGPAGSMVSSVREQVKWLTAHMEQLVSKTPVLDIGQLLKQNAQNGVLNNEFGGHTLGWWFEQLRSDIFLLHHGGETNGFTAHNAVVLQKGLPQFGEVSAMQPVAAISILTNQGSSPATLNLLLQITSFLAELPLIDNLNQLDYAQGAPARARQAAIAAANSATLEQYKEAGKTQPSRFSASELAGIYKHMAYGQLVVKKNAQGSLTVAPNGLDPHPLVHLLRDIFVLPALDPTKAWQFVGEVGGPVTALEVVLEPTVPAIVFDRVASSSSSRAKVSNTASVVVSLMTLAAAGVATM